MLADKAVELVTMRCPETIAEKQVKAREYRM